MDQPTNSRDQSELVQALLEPSVYGPRVDRVDKLETHISYVLLAGTHAYKVKKAVDLGFLDFRTLAARHFYCQEELRLNRRLAPSLYLDVTVITGTPSHPALGGDGPPIEYAVRMRRFSQDQLLDHLLASNRLTTGHIDRLAAKIANFHASVDAATDADSFGTPESIRQPALENFVQIRPKLETSSDLADLGLLQRWTEHQCQVLEEAFVQRKQAAFVRECHGDFHLGNVALFDGEITIFDCLEFNNNLRWIDVMSEAAFMVMDLRAKGHPDLAQRFLNAYLESTGDYAGLRVLRFYLAYRAMVRAKVDLLRRHQSDLSPAQRTRLTGEYLSYVALARSYTAKPRPAMIITHGLSGSGKTTLTQSLLETIGAVRIRSDVERKRLHGLDASARSGSGIEEGLYSKDATALTYRRLLTLAQSVVTSGYTVIVDAAFLRRSERDAFRELAGALAAPFVIIDFVASEYSLRTRITERLAQRNDASEADLAVLDLQLATQEPLERDELPWVFSYDSDRPPADGDRQASSWAPLLDRLRKVAAGFSPRLPAGRHR